MHRFSVKIKITVWYMLVMTVVSATVFMLMNSVNLKSIERNMSERLIKNVDSLTRRVFDLRGDVKQIPGFDFFSDGVNMAVYGENGKLLGGQPPFGISSEFDFEDNVVRESKYNDNNYYEFDKNIHMPSGKDLWIKGLISADNERIAADESAKRNMIFIFIMILIAGVGGYIITFKILEPVKKIQETAKEIIKSKNLEQRINIGSGNDEFHSLANTFDEMLDEIKKVLEREMRFTSDASHELRTPVAVIMSECEYMTKYASSADELKESAESVKNQAKRMSKLISELLSISRMDKNTQKLTFEETNISELVEFVCDEQRQLNSPNICLETHISPNITAEADKIMISGVFINLISNAYKYNKENGKITVGLTQDENNVFFSVKDTGIGIAEENIPKIWERFYRVDEARTSDNNESMGLGLSMVQWIVKKHNGTINVTSKLGVGSEFTFTFPKHNDNKIQ